MAKEFIHYGTLKQSVARLFNLLNGRNTVSNVENGQRDRIISAAELRKLIPFSASYFWRLERAGLFPRRIKLGQRRVGWDRSEVFAWIEAKKSERRS